MPEPKGFADHPAWVTFMPGMRGGEPTIGGTRLPLSIILGNLWLDGVDFVTGTWEVTRQQCLVAAWFAGIYGIEDLPSSPGRNRGGIWRKRYGAWAHLHGDNLWSGQFDKVPDPPTEDTTKTEPRKVTT